MKNQTEIKSLATQETFANKWRLWDQLLFGAGDASESGVLDWILNRNGWGSSAGLAEMLKGKRAILDAGCGNGRVTSLLSNFAPEDAKVSAWDINETAARKNLKAYGNVEVEHVDLSGNEFPEKNFDLIYCQEVLHHLPNPKESFAQLSRKLLPGGLIAIYVYGIKHPFREFSDEWVREVFQSLSQEAQILLSQNITRLGEQLSSLQETLSIEGLEPLGFSSGNYPVQKFFYDYFFKCFWNTQLGEHGSTAVNFDWFSPSLASKHSLSEIESWFRELDLEIVHSLQDEYGITVHGRRT